MTMTKQQKSLVADFVINHDGAPSPFMTLAEKCNALSNLIGSRPNGGERSLEEWQHRRSSPPAVQL
jgi:hypothetical protein